MKMMRMKKKNEKKYENFNPNLKQIVAPNRHASMPADDSA